MDDLPSGAADARVEVEAHMTKDLLQSRLLAVQCRWQRQDDASSAITNRFEELTPPLGVLETRSRRAFTHESRTAISRGHA